MTRNTLARQFGSYLRRRRPTLYRALFDLHGLNLRVSADREETAASIREFLGHAERKRMTRSYREMRCHVFTEMDEYVTMFDRFRHADLLAAWESTGYFACEGLRLIDFHPWATAVIDADHGAALIVLNGRETPPPLIFSNQIFFQTLETLLHTRDLYPIHASAVALGRRAALFPAPSGYGKTTLALTLVNAGYRYLGDDKPLIGRRRGKPIALAFPEPINAYVDELRRFNGLPHRLHAGFPPDFPLKQSFRVETYWPGCALSSARPHILVFPESPDERASSRVNIRPIPPAEGLRRLIELNWPAPLPWGFDGFLDMMRDLVTSTRCYTLPCGKDPDDLPVRIADLLA